MSSSRRLAHRIFYFVPLSIRPFLYKALWTFSGGIALLLLPSCHGNESQGSINVLSSSLREKVMPSVAKQARQLHEFFADSLTVGQRKKNKLTIASYKTTDSLYVDIKLYARQHTYWVLRSSFRFQKDSLTSIDPVFADFNHDGLLDFTYASAVAARGANRVQKLFLYDYEHDRLLNIRNAENYPNLLYNQHLNCLDAFALHGGCTTFFLKISGDSLHEFATVDLSDSLIIRIYDQRGRGKVFSRNLANTTAYVRYQTYYPLQAYPQ